VGRFAFGCTAILGGGRLMRKKVFFIHVGKTAGSSFNQFLRERWKGECHCEKYLEPDGLSFSNLAHLRQLDYVSGHIRYAAFQSHFPAERHFSLTFLREPFSQIISHVNWVMRIHDISPRFFHGHPRRIQEICLELRSLDLTNPVVFINTLIRFETLFRNAQSRYFTGDRDDACVRTVIENLRKLDMVGITEMYEASLRRFMALNQIDTTVETHRENENHHYRIHADIFDKPLIREFITEYNRIDIEVYAHFVERFCAEAPSVPGPGRHGVVSDRATAA
jgi:hypothetical protein